MNYCQSSDSLVLSDNPNKKMIQPYNRTFSISFSLPLYVNPPYSTHTFFLQTAQQFTECLDKDAPHTCHQSHHITGYCKASGSIMLFGLWPLPSTLQLPSMYEEEKVHRFPLQKMFGLYEKKKLYFYFLLKRMQDHVATLIIISIALSSLTSISSMSSYSFSITKKNIFL